MLTALGTVLEPEQETALQPGEVLGRYRLAGRLATGGMATVHVGLAADMSDPSPVVALKLMLPHLSSEREYVEMFLDEARLTRRIRHPNVCAVLDHGEHRGVPYMVMELLVGRDLGQLRKAVWQSERESDRERFPKLLARLLADVCEGLHAAHELRDERGDHLGVVHRDVSPHNIFITDAGIAKLIDFGVAKATQHAHKTATGTVKGKYGYMAPEQLRGGVVDRRADVWSIGVVLWESLTGRRLFSRRTESETILAVLEADVPPLSAFMHEPSAELSAIVERALAIEPEDRYPSAAAMAADLALFATDESGTSVSTAEIGEWIGRLFAAELDRNRTLVRAAVRSIPPDADPTKSRVRSVGRVPWRWLGVAVGAASLVVLAMIALPAGERPASPSDRRPVLTRAEPVAPATAQSPSASEHAAPEPVQAPAAPAAPSQVSVGSVRFVGGPALVRSAHGRVRTPGQLELPPGSHTLQIRTEDGATRALRVAVRSGEVHTIRVPSAAHAEASETVPPGNPGNVFRDLDY